MSIGFGMTDPVVNEPRNEWYQKRNHVRIPSAAEAKKYLDASYTGGEAAPVYEYLFDAEVPANYSNEPSQHYTLATVLNVAVAGTIEAILFYRNAADPATARDVGIYADGNVTSLRVGTSSGEPASTGWIEIPITSLAVSPGTNYVAAVKVYEHYHYTSGRFASELVNGNLTGPASGDVAPGNGRYKTDPTLAYPDQSFGNTWYGVDVKFLAG